MGLLTAAAACGGTPEHWRRAEPRDVTRITVITDHAGKGSRFVAYASNSTYGSVLDAYDEYFQHYGVTRVGGESGSYVSIKDRICINITRWGDDAGVRDVFRGKLTEAMIRLLDDARGSYVVSMPLDCNQLR